MQKNRKSHHIKKTALSSAILCAMGSANAATILVDGSCSLIEAIETANSDLPVGACVPGSGDDTIQVVAPNSGILINTIFSAAGSGIGYTGLPSITSNITIEGNGLTITADNSTDNFRIFDVPPVGDLTLRDTTVTGADDGQGIGSGLLALGGRVTAENTTFTDNNGAILLYGSIGNEINNSVIRHNTNTSTFSAGLQTYYAGVSINNSSFVKNQHTSFTLGGGGLNASGGASILGSQVTVNNSTFSGNSSFYGGGLTFVNYAGPVPPAFISEHGLSPINRGGNGLTITNSTISDNTAFLGGGILHVGSYYGVTANGSIIAGNTSFFTPTLDNIYSTNASIFNLDANNIIGDRGASGANVLLGPSDSNFENDVDENLYPLSLTNGQFVHPLQVGSSAIDGNDPSCFGAVTDQEGKPRSIDGDGNGSLVCDVGAFEHTEAITADGTTCTLDNAIISANTDSSVGGCVAGLGHDVIALPDNSTVSLTSSVYTFPYNPVIEFGLTGITTGVTIDGHGSLIERSGSAAENFDLLFVGNGGQLNLVDSTVSNASGAVSAILSFSGNANVVDTVFSGNYSNALTDFYSVNSSITGSVIDSNNQTASGYAGNYAQLSGFSSQGFRVQNTTISDNVGLNFGGMFMYNVSSTEISNMTISGNTAGIYGGLFITTLADSINVMRNTTITGNQGTAIGGIFANIPTAGGFNISHSIISGNSSTPAPPRTQQPRRLLGMGALIQPFGAFAGASSSEINSATLELGLDGNNIIGQNGDSGTVGATLGGSDIIPAGPTNTVIDALADNGGNSETHMPVAAGLAVDGGDPSCFLNEDQREFIRPADGDDNGSAQCDVGAVEFGSISSSDIIFKDGFDPLIIIRR